MATANEKILEEYLRRHSYMLRFINDLHNRGISELALSEAALRDELVLWLTRISDGLVTKGRILSKAEDVELEDLVFTIREAKWKRVERNVTINSLRYAQNELVATINILNESIPVDIKWKRPTSAHVKRVMEATPFKGEVLSKWFERTKTADIKRITQAAKAGIMQGQTPAQIARQIVGTKSTGYRGAVSRKAFRDLESVLLTTTNGIQNEVRQSLYKENSDVIQQEQFIATLDSKTTFICAGYDNQLFPIGEGPMPPLHFRCRSVRVPYVHPSIVGRRGFDSRTESEVLREYSKTANIATPKSRDALPYGHKTKYDKFYRGKAAELVGQVPRDTAFPVFLRNQTNEFQNNYLGKRKAQLFRAGRISVQQLTASGGRNLTIEELEAL